MIIPDVNLLIYAHVSGYPQHPLARSWWEDSLSGAAEVGVVAPVAMGFIRITTNRRALNQPLTVDEAIGVIEGWLGQPSVRFLPDTSATLRRSFQLLKEVGAAGNLTTDAQIAAHALELGAVVATNDADFARFRSVRTVNPLI